MGLHALAVIGAPNCPLQGPVYPRLVNPSTDPTLQDAFRNLTATFTQRDQDNSTGADSMTYSVEVFSVADDKPIWSWYHTAPTLPSNTTGVKKAGGDTVYRLGSLTKVFSIYTWLVEVGDAHFNEPVSKYVPEVAALAAAADAKKDPVNNVDWNSVTIGSIAAQLTGLVRDCESFRVKYLRLQCSLGARRASRRDHAGVQPERGHGAGLPSAAQRLHPDMRRMATLQSNA